MKKFILSILILVEHCILFNTFGSTLDSCEKISYYPCFKVIKVKKPPFHCGYSGPTAGHILAIPIDNSIENKLRMDTVLIKVPCIETIKPEIKINDTISIICERTESISWAAEPDEDWTYYKVIVGEIEKSCIILNNNKNEKHNQKSK